MKSHRAETTAYEDCLQLALKHYADTDWLGIHSPLAQPYFLGAYINAVPDAHQRGQALQKALAAAWESLWGGAFPADKQTFLDEFRASAQNQGKDARYFAAMLEIRFLNRVTRPKSVSAVWDDYLNISRSQYHRELPEAIRLLGKSLLQTVRPRLLLEQPVPPEALYGRAAKLDELFALLTAGKSLNLFGMSGIGKTSLAAALCQRWEAGAFFWYAIRKNLNDNLERFLFALAFFLHQRGASELWAQILADRGKIANPKMFEGLALHALKNLNPRPLLVIDDADLLQPAMFETLNAGHDQLLSFLKSLSENVVMLFVGQRTTVTDIAQSELKGLDETALAEWLAAANIPAAKDDLKKLLAYTSGAPRLLTLCLALIQSGISAQDVIGNLRGSPNVGALMSRLLSQIQDAERIALAELAVFRHAAPVDSWAERISALESLSARGLIQLDLTGGATLLPIWADLVLGELSPEVRATLHNRAAQVRAERGEYTEAAYHHWQAGYPEAAIQLWYVHREQAIASGQAGNARAIFNAINAQRLPPAERRALALIRAELARLNGDFEKGLRDLNEVEWKPSRASSQAHELRGMLLMALGDNYGALKEYQFGIDDLATITRQQTALLAYRSARLKDEGEYAKAWKELRHAEYLVESFRGNLFHRQGKRQQAKEAYLRAIEIARELGNEEFLARTYTNLGAVISSQSPQEALPYLRLSVETFEKMGNHIEANLARNNIVSALMKAGNYPEALPLAETVAKFSLAIRHRPLAADTTVNLSETFFNLGRFDEAMHWAEVCMAQEQTVVIPYALNIIGLVSNARGNFPHAESCFQQVIQDEISEPEIIACAWRGLGETHKAQGQTEQARECFAKALGMFEEQGNEIEAQKTRAIAQLQVTQ